MKIYKIIIAIVISGLIFSILNFALAADPVNPFQFGIKKKETTQEMRGWKFLPDITQCGKVTRDAEGNITRQYDFGTCMLWLFFKILSVIYTLALLLGVIFLVYAGIEYITKPGEAQKTHDRIKYGITGIVVAIVAFSLVKAIEISLSSPDTGGTVSAPTSPTTPGSPLDGGTGAIQPTTPESPSGQPRVLVDNVGLIKTMNRYVLVFSERLETNDSRQYCDVVLRVFNLTSGSAINDRVFRSDNSTTLHGRSDDPKGLIVTDGRPGDKIQLNFLQNQNCQVPSSITLTVPRESAPVEQPIAEQRQRPVIQIGAPAVLGQQRLTVEIPENLKDVIVQVFDIYFRQSRLYDPPFYMYIRYSVENEQDIKAVNCSLVVSISGIQVSGYSINPAKAVKLKSFTLPPTSFNFRLENGVRNYAKMFYISMGNNIIERVKIRAVELRNCDYAGGDVGRWAYKTEITSQ